jgi:hypothetical protein
MHTPGPWWIAENRTRLVVKSAHRIVAYLPIAADRTEDARLLASAPRLLAVARLMLHGVETRSLPNPVMIDLSDLRAASFPLRPLSDILREALTQATMP